MSLDHIVRCISKPPSQRQESEVSGLVEWFLKMCPLKIKPDVAKDILRNCEFRESRRDDIIIRQGDLGDCFYICLSGKVSVYINTEAVPDDPEDTDQQPVSSNSGANQAATQHSSVAAAVASSLPAGKTAGEKHELDRTKYGNFIVNFGAGKSFGELALINKDCVRNASIIADETTLLIVVNRALYNRSLKVVQEAEYKERIDLVNACDIFDNWASRYKKQAAMSLRKENYAFDAAIVKQGEPLNGLYFITSGQAKVVVNALQHLGQYPQLNWQDAVASTDDVSRRSFTKLGSGDIIPDASRSQTAAPIGRRTAANLLHPHGRLSHPVAAAAAQQPLGQSQRHLEISIVGRGEIVGDIEHGMELPTYSQSVVCTQPSEAFVLDAKNFDRLVLNKRNAARSVQILAERARLKLAIRVGRNLDRQVPLIRLLCRRIEAGRLARELRRLRAAPARPTADILEVKDADVSHFIPSRGPLIDFFGPGTVFWRNRLQRELRNSQLAAEAEKARRLQQLQQQQQQLAGATDPASQEDAQATVTASTVALDDRRLTTTTSTAAAGLRPPFRDFETSSERLSSLEQRIEDWFESLGGTATTLKSAAASPVVSMTRFRNEDDRKIYPGRRVCIRPRHSPTRLYASQGNMLQDSGGGVGFGGEEEVFITAQPEIRSRMSSASAGHRPDEQQHDSGPNVGQGARLKRAQQGAPPQPQQQSLAGRLPRAQSFATGTRATAADVPTAPVGPTAGTPAGQLTRFRQVAAVTGSAATPSSAASSQQSLSSSSPGGLPPIEFASSNQVAGRSAALTPAERRQNTAAVLRDILDNPTLPDDVRATLQELQRMSTVLPDLDSCPHRQPVGAGRSLQGGGIKLGDGKVCYRCRRHHLAATLLN